MTFLMQKKYFEILKNAISCSCQLNYHITETFEIVGADVNGFSRI